MMMIQIKLDQRQSPDKTGQGVRLQGFGVCGLHGLHGLHDRRFQVSRIKGLKGEGLKVEGRREKD